MLRVLALALFVFALAGEGQQIDRGELPFSYFRGEPLHIGNQVQLLADDYVVEDRWKLTRTVGKVKKFLRNPILVRDRPWEDSAGGSPSVLWDEKTHKFRMWYQSFSLHNYFSHDGPSYFVSYAESDDGFNWVKPELEGFPFAGYPRTNVVTAGRGNLRAGAMQVQLNPDQSDPKKRFMMVYAGYQVDLAYSPDGLHWTVVDRPLLAYKSDSPNHMVWNPELGLWFLYERPAVRSNGRDPVPEGLRHTGRRLSLSTSADLLNWSMPRTILYPDERDEPDYDSVLVFRRYGVFLGLYAQMAQEHGLSETETYIATSRDGIRWERTWDRKPFVARGLAGAYDHGQVEPATSPPIEVGEDMLMYFSICPVGQSEWSSESGVEVCRLRKDRFIGQVAGNENGYLLTRQFVLEGNTLKLNCSALPIPYHKESDGIRVAILEQPDFNSKATQFEKAVPGFTLEDSDQIVTDDTAHIVTWNGKSDLSVLRGHAIYLRFRLKNASLYSFQIALEFRQDQTFRRRCDKRYPRSGCR